MEQRSFQWFMVHVVVPSVCFLILTGATWVVSHERDHATAGIRQAETLTSIAGSISSISLSIEALHTLTTTKFNAYDRNAQLFYSKRPVYMDDLERLEDKIDKLLQ
jgi:hypothetical protein